QAACIGRYPPRQPERDGHRRRHRNYRDDRCDATDEVRGAAEMKDRPEHEYQALWAVDPDVSVEGVATLPQPGRLGIPPLVRRQRGVPERKTHEDGEARRREREEHWGPP